nr:hypothetical protein [Bacteroidota bacterium]
MQLHKIIRLALLFIIGSSTYLSAADRYWIATATSFWNTTASWSTTSGGTSGASVPGFGDIAIFNSAKVGSCTINAAVIVAGFDVRTGYSGTISQGANTITIGTSNAIFTAGTFTGGSVAITCNGTFTLQGTSFTSTSDTLHMKSTVTNTSGTFTHNLGVVKFNATTAQTIPSWTFQNIVTTGTRAANSITLASGTVTISGTFTNTATFTSGNFINTGNTVTFNGTNSQKVPAIPYNHLTISGSYGVKSVEFASSGTVSIAGTFTNTASFAGGGFIMTSSTVDFKGGSQNIPAFTFNNLTCSGSADKTATGAVVVNGVLNIATSRILDMSTNALTGTISSTSGTGTLRTQNTGTPIPTGESWSFTVEYNGGTQSVLAGTYVNLTCSGSGDKTATGAFVVN